MMEIQLNAGGDYSKPFYDDSIPFPVGDNLQGRARLQFVRKVYAILITTLLITVGMCVASMYSTAFSNFQLQYYWIMYITMVVAIIAEIVILCFKPGRRPPYNYLLLLVFTLCQSYMVSFICAIISSYEGKGIVLMAALMTLGIVVAATAYAMITRQDFTIKWGLVWVLIMSMFMLTIFGLFWPGPFLNSLYCSLGVLLFGIYLIIDTQLILGNKRIAFTVDEYVAAAMLLYVDIIQIFLYILSMLGGK